MISTPFLIFFIIVLFVYLYKTSTKSYDYFSKRGIKFLEPLPFIGTSAWMLRREIFVEFLRNAYNKFNGEKVFGIFDFQRPVLILRDPEVIKDIAVKNFDHFMDHRSLFKIKPNDLLGNTLVFLKGKRWHEMRTSLSPAFTGSKMRLMFDLISTCGQQVVSNLQQNYKKHGLKPYDMKDLCTKFTCDVIATCAFGLKCDSFDDPKNDFYKLGMEMLEFRKLKTLLKLLTMRFFPNFAELMKIDFFTEETKQVFNKMIIETMKVREKHNIVRPDMINLLMELKRGDLKAHADDEEDTNGVSQNTAAINKNWTDNELIAQCLIFFLAGFDTTSTLLVFMCYELAMQPEIQETLRQELQEVKEKLNGKPLTYEAAQEMRYMDMVVAETLRKWPPGPFTDRVCTTDYKYEDQDGLKFELKTNDIVWIPIYSLHRDPNYFPDPDKFDPERFSEDNKHNFNSFPYMPFGIGPRNCIGSRFALLEVKTLLYYILNDFSVEVCKETIIPLKLRPTIIGLTPAKNVILNLKPLRI